MVAGELLTGVGVVGGLLTVAIGGSGLGPVGFPQPATVSAEPLVAVGGSLAERVLADGCEGARICRRSCW